jgi:hypothetical protein
MPAVNPTTSQPTLKFFAGLWTLREYPDQGREWTMPEKFAEVRRRGFEAIGGRFLPEAPELCARHGLEYILYIDADASNCEEQLRRAVAFQPKRINVQLCDHDTPPAEAVATWIEMNRCAAALGLAIDLELHRDTATETPEKAYALADRFHAATGQPIRFCLDFSHFSVTKHLVAPFAPRLLERPELLAPVRQMHLRPFNGHHAQIPATDGRGGLSPEMHDYLDFLDTLFGALRTSSDAGDVFYACPENGPRGAGGYALSCFPDVWEDAVRVRDEARRLWLSQPCGARRDSTIQHKRSA